MPATWNSDYVADLHSKLDPEVKAVVVGFDTNISYVKITKACNYLQPEGSVFLVKLHCFSKI